MAFRGLDFLPRNTRIPFTRVRMISLVEIGRAHV